MCSLVFTQVASALVFVFLNYSWSLDTNNVANRPRADTPLFKNILGVLACSPGQYHNQGQGYSKNNLCNLYMNSRKSNNTTYSQRSGVDMEKTDAEQTDPQQFHPSSDTEMFDSRSFYPNFQDDAAHILDENSNSENQNFKERNEVGEPHSTRDKRIRSSICSNSSWTIDHTRPLPWTCNQRKEWVHLQSNIYPSWIQRTVCEGTCWFGHFNCTPVTFTTMLLRLCFTPPCSDDRVPYSLRRSWHFTEYEVTVGCTCSA